MWESLWHMSEEENQEDSAESTLSSMLDQLWSDNQDERWQAAIAILKLSPWKTPNEITQMIYHSKNESTLEVFGWIEYCMDESIDISLDWIETVCIGMMKHYSESVAIILHGGNSDRLEDKKSSTDQTRSRMKSLIFTLTQKEDEEVKNYGYFMTLKLLDIFEEDINRIQAFYDTCPSIVQRSREIIAILADGYERAKDYPRAYEIYHTLQVRTGEAHFLWCQISLLYKMGRVDEARSLYAFGSAAWIHGNMLFPEWIYRWTIESDDDLCELYIVLLPLYKGDRLDEMTQKIIGLASEYVFAQLTKIESHFITARKWDGDIYDEEFHLLWWRKLFLLEVAVWMLWYTGSFGPFPEWIALEYVLVLRDLFVVHQEVYQSSILDHYFSTYSQEWMDKVCEIQGDHMQEAHNDGEGGWHDDRNFVAGNEISDAEDFFVTQRLDSILYFLLDRVENDTRDNQELLDEIIEFQRELSEYSEDIVPIDISDVRFAGELIRKALHSLSPIDREQYQSLLIYTQEHYGHSISQFLFFLSANTSQSDEMPLQGIQKDPKLLLLSIVITLLGLETPPLPRMREFITNPILEALSEGEIIFLSRMLYRAGLFREVCLFLVEDGEAFGYAECVELFFQSLSFLDQVTKKEFYTWALDIIEELFDYEDFSQFLEGMRLDLPETEPHVLHAQMILDTMTDIWVSHDDEVPLSLPHRDLTSHEASMRFTALRCMEVWEWDREQWTRALIDIYPLLDIDKKHALEVILSWSFYFGWKDELQRFVALWQSEGLPIGYWQYAHLLLWNTQEQQEWIYAISKDPFLHIIPEAFIWWMDKNFPHELDEWAQGEHMLPQKFQLSYIRAYSWLQGKDKLERIVSHFQTLDRYISIYKNGNLRFDAISVEGILDLFHAVDYTIETVSNRNYTHRDKMISPFEKLTDLLARHVWEFRRYLSLVWDEEPDGDIMSQEAQDSWYQIIYSLESIASWFDLSSLEYLRLSVIIGQLKKEWWIPSRSWEKNDGLCDDWRVWIPQGFS